MGKAFINFGSAINFLFLRHSLFCCSYQWFHSLTGNSFLILLLSSNNIHHAMGLLIAVSAFVFIIAAISSIKFSLLGLGMSIVILEIGNAGVFMFVAHKYAGISIRSHFARCWTWRHFEVMCSVICRASRSSLSIKAIFTTGCLQELVCLQQNLQIHAEYL